LRVLALCNELSSILPEKVFFQGAAGYNTSISSYFFLGQRQSPACIVAPSSAEDVAEIVKAVGPQASYQVALRSGGHSPNTGFSNADHGVTIDLRGLNRITSQGKTSDVVSVGTGATWIDVYRALEDLNRTAVGARVASVGVGGFITGGKPVALKLSSFFS
jgi:FAD/FMN-containing dehydrogenase